MKTLKLNLFLIKMLLLGFFLFNGFSFALAKLNPQRLINQALVKYAYWDAHNARMEAQGLWHQTNYLIELDTLNWIEESPAIKLLKNNFERISEVLQAFNRSRSSKLRMYVFVVNDYEAEIDDQIKIDSLRPKVDNLRDIVKAPDNQASYLRIRKEIRSIPVGIASGLNALGYSERVVYFYGKIRLYDLEGKERSFRHDNLSLLGEQLKAQRSAIEKEATRHYGGEMTSASLIEKAVLSISQAVEKVLDGEAREEEEPITYNADYYKEKTKELRLSDAWNQDIQRFASLLDEQIEKNQRVDFLALGSGGHNLARNYIIGKRNLGSSGPWIDPATYTILNDKMALLEAKTGTAYYVLMPQVDYYIPQSDPENKRDQAAFAQAVLEASQRFPKNKAILIQMPTFVGDKPEVGNGGLRNTKAFFPFPHLHQSADLPDLARAFNSVKEGSVWKLVLEVYKQIPKPHLTYELYFHLSQEILYLKQGDENKLVQGEANIYDFNLLLDTRFQEILDLRNQPGGNQAYAELAEEIYTRDVIFEPLAHGLREIFLEESHRPFGHEYVRARYHTFFDYLLLDASKVPNHHLVVAPKEGDLVQNILDYSSFLLSPTGLDVIPDAIGFIYAQGMNDQDAKVKYLAGIMLAGPSQWFKKFSIDDIKGGCPIRAVFFLFQKKEYNG